MKTLDVGHWTTDLRLEKPSEASDFHRKERRGAREGGSEELKKECSLSTQVIEVQLRERSWIIQRGILLRFLR
jgi:hypothetical protein